MRLKQNFLFINKLNNKENIFVGRNHIQKQLVNVSHAKR